MKEGSIVPRRGNVPKREILPDPVYGSVLVTKLVNSIMSSRKVKVGDVVKQGQVIGITGCTGNSTGPHLHFGITENGTWIDPLKYLTDYIKSW